MIYKKIKKCRICKSKNLQIVLNLGSQALTGKFPKSSKKKILKTPLSISICKHCKFVQLTHNFDNTYLYNFEYGYESGINSTMKNHLSKIAQKVSKIKKLTKKSVVVDIASNDGTLLNSYNKNIVKVGIDPILNRFKKNYKNIKYKIPDFFSYNKFKNLKLKKKADVITAFAVFYDISNPNDFLSDIKKCLDEKGIFVIEQSNLAHMINLNSFDTICQEHLGYYSTNVIKTLLERNKLKIFDHEYNESNGGSSRFYICHKENYRYKKTIILKKAIHLENKSKIDNIKTLKRFGKKINKLKKKILHVINTYKKKGLIHGYGASTKGNVLLQYFKVDKKTIDCIADRNPFKWGKCTPGTNIKIISEKTSRLQKPKLYIVLPWHFKKEIIKREKNFLKNKGTLFFPLPKCVIIRK